MYVPALPFESCIEDLFLSYFRAVISHSETLRWILSIKRSPSVVSMGLRAVLSFVFLSQCGWTALHYAAFDGNATMVNMLLDAGADSTIEDNVGLPVTARSRSTFVSALHISTMGF